MTVLKNNIRTFIISVVLLFGFLSACSTIEEQGGPSSSLKGQLSIFMVVPEETVPEISFTLAALHIMSENGTSEPITTGTRVINSISVAGRQINLAESLLRAGKYTELALIINSASMKENDKSIPLITPDERITVPVNVTLKRQQNTSLFIYWNADGSVADGNVFSPLMVERKRKQELSSALIYVTNEHSDNVSVINRYTGEVVETVSVGRKPRGIAVSFSATHPRLFVANSGSDNISVIDPATNRVEQEVPVRFGIEPVDVTVADITSDRKLLFVANYRSNNVSIVDLATYGELEKIDVGSGPVALASDPPADTLAVNRYLSSHDINELRSYREKFLNVYVVNQNSHNVSILRIDIMTGRCVDVMHLDVDWDPRSLYVDYIRGRVYVANYGSDKLSVINILKILSAGGTSAVTSMNNVGNRITAVISDPFFNRLYLLRDSPGEIVILRPSRDENDSVRTMMSPVMGRIGAGNAPRALMLDPEKRKIYVVNRNSDDIYIIDKTTRKTDQIIQVGKKPYDIAVLSE
jgi:YVTN family beta-propeller protein